MKINKWVLCTLTLLLVSIAGFALAADASPLLHMASTDPTGAMLMAIGPLALRQRPLAAAVATEFGRKESGSGGGDDVAAVVTKELGRVQEQIKEFCEKNRAAIEDAGKLSKEAKAEIDKLLSKQGDQQAQISDLAQKLSERERERRGAEHEGNLLLTALTAGAEQADYKDFIAHPAQAKHVRIPIERKALTNSGVTGAALVYPGAQAFPGVLSPLQRRLTVRDLLAKGRISGPVLWYNRESGFTNNAAVVSEGSLKPKSELTVEQITENVRTIAHLLDVSLQMLADVPFIESYIRTRLLDGLKLVEENQLLTGSGTGQNLEGIYTAATAYSQPSGAIVGGTAGETDLDKLRLALLQVELAFAFASGIVLHPTDWANIELLKDTTGQYIFANPQNGTTPRLWGRDVVSTPAMTQGRFLVGDFAAHAQIFDREDANVAISFENKDNFERNMATIRVEERLALAIYRPEAFIKGTLESAS